MTPLQVVCLISGGKDSLFSILHCLEVGHQVVALANLHPPFNQDEDAGDDLDSYMYQTIGHTVIPLYEQALGLPVYRQEIRGTHANQDKNYGPNSDAAAAEDETEALVPLLQAVKSSHPEVNAVSTGAILSDYQRTRVESVAIRLGLTPLALLWQWPFLPPHSESSLLSDMAAVGQDSRIIKVASGGLDEKFLWQNIAEPRTIKRLESAARRFGSAEDGAVLGEGGEYETLAVSGPTPLWKARISIDEEASTPVSSGAGASSMRIVGAKIEPMPAATGDVSQLRRPALLEDRFTSLLKTIQAVSIDGTSLGSGFDIISGEQQSNRPTMEGHSFLPNLTADGTTPADQARSVMEQARKALQSSGHTFKNVAYTSIILRDMAAFGAVNAVYGSYFRHPNPPARVTIACSAVLPERRDVMISFTSTSHQNSSAKTGLHVQSRSYWAPANIGPYSQAISVPLRGRAGEEDGSLIFIAGQIPLEPSSMELPTPQAHDSNDPFCVQAVLALQHAIRIGRVMQVRKWASTMVFLTANSTDEARFRGQVVCKAWKELHRPKALTQAEGSSDEDESFDIWDIKYGKAKDTNHNQQAIGGESSREYACDEAPPLHVVQVDSLPREASVEWVTYGLTAESCQRPDNRHFDSLLQVFESHTIKTESSVG